MNDSTNASSVGLNVCEKFASSFRRQSSLPERSARVIVQVRVSDELFRLPFLVLELQQAPQFANPEPAVHYLPAIERLLRSPRRPDDFGHRRAGFRLLQRKSNVLAFVPELFSSRAPCPEGSQDRNSLADV